MKTHDKSV